jgi:hypothetical protein
VAFLLVSVFGWVPLLEFEDYSIQSEIVFGMLRDGENNLFELPHWGVYF